ncbi:protocatechuate 3,4-dioxygenase subunit alpha [Rhodopila sp.]|uniref:protocatechuate 3,4-dioxygenase subunit alpha n=1 Tax=Rhodopila sp. TaxID=2480087 RepID=UPI003D1535E2
MPVATASQTIGPFWHLIEDPDWADLLRFGAGGDTLEDTIVLTGVVTDGAGQPVTDAAIEIWQTSPATTDIFPGYGRSSTDATGRFHFRTLMPGPVASLGNAQQAPHVAIAIFARGLLTGLTTRLYFEGEPLNETDPVLSLIEDPARRRTLIAHAASPRVWTLDIRLQGDNETVFMEL